MPPSQEGPQQTTARFMLASRLHLGLIETSPALRPPRQVSGPLRRTLHSLIVAGLFGGLFGEPAFATVASRLPGESGESGPAGSFELAEDQPARSNSPHLPAIRQSNQ